MPTFTWIAKDAEGRTKRGSGSAASEGALLQSLRTDGLVTLEVRGAAEPAGGPDRPLWHRVARPRSEDVELGLQQIAFMLGSGLPLTSALETCALQSLRGSMAWTWRHVSERIRAGVSFSDALLEHRCFPRVAVTMVKLGEATGILEEVLNRAADSMERRRLLRQSVMTALAYPAIVLVLAVGVVAFMMIALIPKLTKFLLGFHRKLPPVTQLLVDISAFVQQHAAGIGIGLAAGAAVLAVLRAWPPGRLATDGLILRGPVVGRIVRLAETSTFARNLGVLVASGVRITDALDVVAPLLSNARSAAVVRASRERILQGSPLSEPLSVPGPFYPMLASMVAVGERSGTLDEVLLQVAGFHEARLQVLIRRLGAIIEPVVIIVVGGIVGFVYLAFFLAIYSIVGGK